MNNNQNSEPPNSAKGLPPLRGPKNPNHKIYLFNNHLIHIALCDCIAHRRVDIKACELYHSAGISAPSFYLRYQDAGDAMRTYESDLVQMLDILMPSHINRLCFFSILTSFINKYREYFQATTQGGNVYWLTHFLADHREDLVGSSLGDDAFIYYVGAVTTIITCWIKCKELNPTTAAQCARELANINIARLRTHWLS